MAALNHLHLHVASVERARDFYHRWFGLQPQGMHGDVLFMRDDGGLDLALAPGPRDELPPWFHFGFRLESSEAVRALHDRLAGAGAELAATLSEETDFVWFRCRDPDDHLIEVYWEP
jgi:catechol 2,3-dioxygenase-like lactoylglutathione lyase family enzyme